MLKWIDANTKDARRLERIGCNLYRRNDVIYCRVWVDSKRTFRCRGTNNPTTARKILKEWENNLVLQEHGIETRDGPGAESGHHRPGSPAIQRGRFSRSQNENQDGCHHRAGEQEPAAIGGVFSDKPAIGLMLKDCDAYRQWRANGGYTWKRGEAMRKSRAGTGRVDIELQTLGNALALAVRRGKLKLNPLAGRARYHSVEDTRHCRGTAPTAQQLQVIEATLRQRSRMVEADCIMFLAFSGLRVHEALPSEWEAVDWPEGIIHVKREKRGINPFVPILPEMEALLRQIQTRVRSRLLFPSELDVNRRFRMSLSPPGYLPCAARQRCCM